MAATGTITMTMRELDRLKTIQAVVDGNLKPGRAAERLGLSDRQLRRLVVRYRESGAHGLASRKRGTRGNHCIDPAVSAQALRLIAERYSDFGPTLACEKLRECHNLKLAKETVRRLMIDAEFWVPRRQRPPKVHQPRYRRPCLGELVQIDGSDHHWFEDRAPACTVLVFVDDATSRIMELRFTHSESAFSYFEATRAYITQHGKPVALYSDKASVFRVNKGNAQGGKGHTQFGRMLYELNIEGICANSSQAKGRVERAHKTLQDRLVKELRLRGISSIGDANAFAPHFCVDYNRRFGKLPRSSHDAHRPIRADEDLDLIFAWKELRCVSKALTVQYDKVLYLLSDSPETRKLAGRYIDIFHYPDGRIEPRADGCALPFTEYDRLTTIDHGAVVDNKRLGHVLKVAELVQAKRDNKRASNVPTNLGETPHRRGRPPGKKAPRALDSMDVNEAIRLLQTQTTAPIPA